MKVSHILILITTLLTYFLPDAWAQDKPACLCCEGSSTIASVVAASGIADKEVLARLVYAESSSTGYADNLNVYVAIAWGVMNRVRLSQVSPSRIGLYGSGIRGVIFKKGQFNPAVSKSSPFSRYFLCPHNSARWGMASYAAGMAMKGEGNPFIQTPWEREHGISLVVNFYYPCSIQAKTHLAPWEETKGMKFIGDVLIDGKILPSTQVRFYRLTRPPSDIHILR
jgi:hypothetical protein